MKKKYLFLFYGVLTVFLSCSFALVACDPDFASSNSNPFVGTWTGNYNGGRTTMVITDSSWRFSISYYGYSEVDSGTYTVNGNNATFYSDYGGYMKGFVSENRLTLYEEYYGSAIVLYK